MRSLCTSLAVVFAIIVAIPQAHGEDPKDLLGTWTWTWTDSAGVLHKHFLEVEGSGEKIAVRERFDELEPVKVNDLKVAEKTVSFSVRRNDRRAAYTGKIKDGDRIEGLVTISDGGQPNEFGWSAQRVPVK